jgi:hypothetical protein
VNEIVPYVHKAEVIEDSLAPSDLLGRTARELLEQCVAWDQRKGEYPARHAIEIPPSLRLWQIVMAAGGCVNDRYFCGADPGTILIEAAERRSEPFSRSRKETLLLTVAIANEPWKTATGELRRYKQMASCRPVDFEQIFGPAPENERD